MAKKPESDTTAMRWTVNRPESVQDVVSGDVYYAYKVNGDGNELANDGSIDIVITSPATKALGIGFVAIIAGDSEIKVYEDVTVTSGGTVVVPTNRNRTSSKTSSSGVLVNPTLDTLPSVLYESLIIGGQGGHAAGVTHQGDYAVIKPDTSYLFRLTNRSGQAQIAQLTIQWVE